jgi:hypothetical protein
VKAAQEVRVLERLDKDESPTKAELARRILPLLEENRQSWAQYGPMSELARTQPHNDAAHAVGRPNGCPPTLRPTGGNDVGREPDRTANGSVVQASPDYYLVWRHDAVRQNREKPS